MYCGPWLMASLDLSVINSACTCVLSWPSHAFILRLLGLYYIQVWHQSRWGLQLKLDTLLRSLRLKLGPREVDKVAKVQAKKSLIKNSEICNFCATQTLYTSKESWQQSSVRFEIKLVDFVMKKLKKIWLWIPKNHNFLLVLAEFLKNLSR